MKIHERIIITMLLLLALPQVSAHAKGGSDSLLLHRVFTYRQSIQEPLDGIHTNVYLRFSFKTVNRNFTLMAIPSMYAISRGLREYAGESYSNIYINNNTITDAVLQLNTGTIPHHKQTMTVMLQFIMPDIYGVTMFNNLILSPLNSRNTSLYRYYITYITDNRAEIVFRPKRHNTQLISGSAIVDRSTGRVSRIKFNGEHDMVKIRVDATMGRRGLRSLLPKTCDINATFHFIGNKIEADYHSVYDNPITLPDSIVNSHDDGLMAEVRPDPVPEDIKRIYITADSIKHAADTVKIKNTERKWTKVLWNSFGDYVVNRTKGKFGTNNQGAFRISPILNPLSLTYSGHRGITYKFFTNGTYRFTPNRDISIAFNGGYSFKQRQLYFNVPIKFNYNKRRNGYIGVEVGNGNRITNSDIVEQVKHETLDSIDWDKMNLEYFKDLYVKFVCNYDLSSKWSIQPGLMYHRRDAVNKAGFELAGRPVRYYSLAPSMQIQFRPSGWDGPIITADYERGIKAGKADMEYERFEFDVSWIKSLYSLRSVSMRFGSGFYTARSRNSYFLDYTNFRDQNIPSGWNDDWTGEFQLLNRNWYNASEYYIRTNVTYESPLMIFSRIPYIGRLIEMERIYMNVLFVEHLTPYIEYGYGFTNRFFSMGIFMATRNKDFEGIGCRFGIELFRDW